MKRIFGIVVVIFAIWVAVYVGLWVCCFEAIAKIVDAFAAHSIVGNDIALQLMKICIGTPFFEMLAIFMAAAGVAMINDY